MNAPRALFLLGDEKGPALWRVMSPCRMLQRHGVVADWCPLDDWPRILPAVANGRYDVLILPRLGFSTDEAREAFFASFHRARLRVIYDIDDDVFSPTIVARQRGTVERDKALDMLEHQRQLTIRMIRDVDGVTVSTPTLAHVVAGYTERPVRVVPNAIDTDFWSLEVRRAVRRVKELTIGWAGGVRPGDDLRPVAQAWARLAERYKRVHFVCTVTTAELFGPHLPKHRLHVLPWLPVDWSTKPDGTLVPPYPHGMVNIDIGCAAVSPRLFNVMKTPIKVWEYTLAGAAVVATPTLYSQTITPGEDGLLAETADEWERALASLLEDPELRARLQRNQKRRIYEQHSLARNWQRWTRAWLEILAEAQERDARRVEVAHGALS